MVSRYSGNLVLQCEATDTGLPIRYFNGLPSHVLKEILKQFHGVMTSSDSAKEKIRNAKSGDKLEMLVRVTYQKHHGMIIGTSWHVYKVREPKCTNGLKPFELILKD